MPRRVLCRIRAGHTPAMPSPELDTRSLLFTGHFSRGRSASNPSAVTEGTSGKASQETRGPRGRGEPVRCRRKRLSVADEPGPLRDHATGRDQPPITLPGVPGLPFATPTASSGSEQGRSARGARGSDVTQGAALGEGHPLVPSSVCLPGRRPAWKERRRRRGGERPP